MSVCRSLVVHIRTLSFRPPKPCTLSLCIQESSVYRVTFHMVGIKFYKLAQGRRAAQPLSVRCIYCCNLQENIWYAPVNFTWTRKGNSCFVLRNKKKTRKSLLAMHWPLVTITVTPLQCARKCCGKCGTWICVYIGLLGMVSPHSSHTFHTAKKVSISYAWAVCEPSTYTLAGSQRPPTQF